MRRNLAGTINRMLMGASLAAAAVVMVPTLAAAACKAPLTFEGPPRPTPAIADFNAIERWQWDAEKKYARRFSDWRHARDAKTECRFILIGFVCTATGRPCDR